MSKVVQLAKGESPPENEPWVMVTRLPSGKYEISATYQSGPEGSNFGFVGGIPKPLDQVIDMARGYASQMTHVTVYVHANVHAD